MLGFIIWTVAGIAFIALGLYAFFSKREVAFGFWANAKMFPVNDVHAYNCAVGKMWCVFGIVFILLGIPLLGGQNSPGAILTIIGTMIESIAVAVVYTTVIEPKYRRK